MKTKSDFCRIVLQFAGNLEPYCCSFKVLYKNVVMNPQFSWISVLYCVFLKP